MKKTLLALVAAFAVILGFVSTAGVAAASAPTRHGGGGIICTGTPETCTFANGGALPGWLSGRITPCTITAPATNCTLPLPGWRPRGGLGLGLGLHGPFGGGLGLGLNVLPGGLLPLNQFSQLGLTGNFGNSNINVCTIPYWSNAAQFLEQQYGVQQGQLDGLFNGGGNAQLVWAEVQAQAGCGGQLGFNQGALGLNGLGYNGLVGGASYTIEGTQNVILQGQVLDTRDMGIAGFPAVNVCQFRNWDSFRGFGQRFGGVFNPLLRRFGGDPVSAFERAQRRAACTAAELAQLQAQVSSQQVLVLPSSFDGGYPQPVAPAVNPEPSTVPCNCSSSTPQASTTPAPSGNTIVEIPSGPIQTGDSGIAPDAMRVG